MNRPEAFASETRDCTVIALSNFATIPYHEAHRILSNLGRKRNHGIKFKEKALMAFGMAGYRTRLVKRSGSVGKLIEEYPDELLFVLRRGHAFCINQSVILDDTTNNKHHVRCAWVRV